MTARAKPHCLVMHEAVQFGQNYTYIDEAPIEDMCQGAFWIGAGLKRFKIGDEIKVKETGRKAVGDRWTEVLIAVAILDVVEVLPDALVVNVRAMHEIQPRPKVKDLPKKAA